MHNKQVNPSISTEAIISNIWEVRKNYITNLINEDMLLVYLEENFNTIAISHVKLEFIKRDLKELRDSSLDLVHYASIIRDTKILGSNSFTHENPLLEIELTAIFKKYGLAKPA
jgi:hypothetical protein